MVWPLGLWLLWALAVSQEICRSPGDLPAPSLLMDKGSAHHRDSIILLCFIPTDTSVKRIIFCKDGKEISTLPMNRNKFVFELAQPASLESAGNYSCRYQHKDDRNQERNSLPSASRYLSAPDLPGARNSAGEASAKGSAALLWIWILRSSLVLLLVMSAPIITCIVGKRAAPRPDLERQERPGGNGREEPPCAEGSGSEEEKEEEAEGSGGL